MKESNIDTFISTMNYYGKIKKPFLFIVDFELKKPLIMPLENASGSDILFSVNGVNNVEPKTKLYKSGYLKKVPIPFELYEESFNKVKAHLLQGNSYLLNLTFPTPIYTNLTLEDIFHYGNAPYRLFLRDHFVVFSPESFIRITDGTISSFPMKGTIDASIPNARNLIMDDQKEIAEHYTIVDLIRNDLSMVAADVEVKKFRYLDEVISSDRKLFQVSSHISGKLPPDYTQYLGDILYKLLPAGSICGAPKKKTIEIIRETEIEPRGYYTGVFGIFDGKDLESAVMIRYIEKRNGKMIYHSGGGITVNSDARKEYQELLDKIYFSC